ncbi:CpsD/CapB family tyrosine-protein kinase [Candidatus Poribacteria bacterium]|nr:CpsD/CapB family tyrosine-protein kinase [Candidatus Poribacteria bacterium]
MREAQDKLLQKILAKAGSPAYGAYRGVASSFTLEHTGPQVLLITSSIRGEGKTATALNLAFHLAKSGKKVLLVDANVFSPRLTEILGLQSSAGLVDAVTDATPVLQAINALPDLSLDAMGSGAVANVEPLKVFCSETFKGLLKDAKAIYDLVILDAPAVAVSMDSLHLSDETDKIIYVVAPEMLTKRQLLWAKAELERFWKKELRLLLNRHSEPIPRFLSKLVWGG